MIRLLKNRKSARKSRRRRKAELQTLREEIKALKRENEKLKKLVVEEESTQLTDQEPHGGLTKKEPVQTTCPPAQPAPATAPEEPKVH